MKRVLSLILAFVMVFSLLPMDTFAAEIELPETQTEEVTGPAVDLGELAEEPEITPEPTEEPEVIQEPAEEREDGPAAEDEPEFSAESIQSSEETEDIPIDEAHFPSDALRNYVNVCFDRDGDGILSLQENKNATGMTIRNAESLEGIANLPYLEQISCQSCQLTSVDFSANRALVYLDCSVNQLTALDLRGNPNLERLECWSNQLTSLDVSANKKLKWLSCSSNPLTALDVSANNALETLDFGRSYITEMDVSQNTALVSLGCNNASNKYPYLERLVLGNHPAMESIVVNFCKIQSIDISNCPNLNRLGLDNNDNLYELDVSQNPKLVELSLSNCPVSELDLTNQTALKYLFCENDRLTSLNVSNCPELEYCKCAINRFSELDIRNCPYLEAAYYPSFAVEKTRFINGLGDCIYYEYLISGSSSNYTQHGLTVSADVDVISNNEYTGDIGSCKLTYKGGTKSFDHDLTYYISNANPVQYNRPLAEMLSVLASAAYNKTHVKKSMRQMGFTLYDGDMHNYDGYDYYSAQYKDTVGYSFAKKTADDGTVIVAVLIRGTYGNIGFEMPEDWKSDFRIRMTTGPHPGFKRAEAAVFADLRNYVAEMDGDIKYVITGHSRGAGVGNLLAKHLIDTGMATSNNLLAYNFACPDSAVGGAGDWNPGGKYNSIFNINNVCDIIGVVPGALMSDANLATAVMRFLQGNFDLNPFRLTWGKFGHTYFYSTDWTNLESVAIGNPFVHHDDRTYVTHMSDGTIGAKSNFKSWADARMIMIALAGSAVAESALMTGRLFALLCPADIVLTDENGKAIAAVINNEPIYYDVANSGDSVTLDVFIWVEGEEKYIYLSGGQEVTVRLIGTGEGEMAFAVINMDQAQEEANVLAEFDNVALEVGKIMISTVTDDSAEEPIRLIVVNEDSTPIGEVLPDGTENSLYTPVQSLYLDRDYLILTPDETAELSVIGGIPEDRVEDVSWGTESGSEEVIVVQNGRVTAIGPGTDYAMVTLSLKESGKTLVARCRIDVVEGDSETPIYDEVSWQGVRLPDTKATVELFKTDYTKVRVELILAQNISAESNVIPQGDQDLTGIGAIQSARFLNADAAALFNLRPADDGTLEIIPKDSALAQGESAPKGIKGSYKTQIAVTIEGKELTAEGTLTLTVKKSLPNIKAKAVKLNTAFLNDEQVPVFTGGTVTAVELDPAKIQPDWLTFNAEDGTVTYAGTANAKKSGKLYVLVTAEGWAIKKAVTVSVSAAKTAPKLTFKPASLTLLPVGENYAQANVTVTPTVYTDGRFPVQISRITEVIKKAETAAEYSLDCEYTDGVLIVRPAEGLDTAKAHTFKVYLSVSAPAALGMASVEKAVTVKTPAAKAPAVTLKASGAIDLTVKDSPATIKATSKDYPIEKMTFSVADVANAKTKAAAKDQFRIDVDGSTITLRAGNGLAKGTYTVSVLVEYAGGSPVTKTVNITVKESAASKVQPSVSLKAAGSIDVLRPGTTVTVTPTVKNCFHYELSPADVKVVWTYDGALKEKLDEDVTELFNISVENGKYVLTRRAEIAGDFVLGHMHKYSVQATVRTEDGPLTAKAVSLKVVQGKAKVVQSTKAVTLLKQDRFSEGEVRLTLTDPTLDGIARVELDAKSAALFDLKDLGNGVYAIGYAGDRITTTKSATVKLRVFLYGNPTETPNATISVKVNIK